MTEVPVADLRRRYATVLDQDVPGDLWVEDFDADTDAAGMRRKLRASFDIHQGVDRILVRVEGRPIGIAGRDTVFRDLGHAGADAPGSGLDPGSSDGATLPGHSGDYRLITFRCCSAKCAARELRSYYDERRVPHCPHGRMKVEP